VGLGDRTDRVDDRVVRALLGRGVEQVGVRPVGLGAGGRLRVVPAAGEPAASQWAPDDRPDAVVEAQRDHLAFLFAGEQVVVVLHGHEPGPVMALLQVQRLGELPRVHRRGAETADLADRHEVAEGGWPRYGTAAGGNGVGIVCDHRDDRQTRAVADLARRYGVDTAA
jgi:hypothetical protein